MTQTSVTYELPSDFPHSPPNGYSYHVEKHNAKLISIWLLHHRRYVFCDDNKSVRTIWGFYNTKTKCYYAPINSSKQGNQVALNDTTPYTSMPIQFSNPLEHALFGNT